MAKLKKVLRAIPIPVRVLFCLFLISVLLHISFALSQSFAEFYLGTVGHFFRSLFAAVTNPLPFSLAEAIFIFLPFVLIYMVVCILKDDLDFDGAVGIISSLAALVLLVYSLFILTFAAGFYTGDIGEHFGVSRRDVTVDELYEAAIITVEGVNEAYSEIDGKGPDSTSMGMTPYELSIKLLGDFDSLNDKFSFPYKMTSRVKPVTLSEPMTYTHISGIYSYFTGESNININYPDFVIPYTAAHELSHQRGVSRENEANFVAFLVCMESDDPYIRYSGYLNMYQYMANAVASVSYEKYADLAGMLDDGVKKELIAYSEFFDKYRDNIAADVSDTVNDAYLTVMSGTDSPGLRKYP